MAAITLAVSPAVHSELLNLRLFLEMFWRVGISTGLIAVPFIFIVRAFWDLYWILRSGNSHALKTKN